MCYNCHEYGHMARDCLAERVNPTPEATQAHYVNWMDESPTNILMKIMTLPLRHLSLNVLQ
jgi:Zinc knuckle.